MGASSPRYTAEFKQEAVELYGKSGTTYAEAARGPGCDAGDLSDWAKKADAAMESLMGIVESECVHARACATREEAALDIFGYIEAVYNRVRIHSALGYMSPAEFEEANWPYDLLPIRRKEHRHPRCHLRIFYIGRSFSRMANPSFDGRSTSRELFPSLSNTNMGRLAVMLSPDRAPSANAQALSVWASLVMMQRNRP